MLLNSCEKISTVTLYSCFFLHFPNKFQAPGNCMFQDEIHYQISIGYSWTWKIFQYIPFLNNHGLKMIFICTLSRSAIKLRLLWHTLNILHDYSNYFNISKDSCLVAVDEFFKAKYISFLMPNFGVIICYFYRFWLDCNAF